MTELWDMVIVGGGPAGASAAILLASAGRRVAVCEGKMFPREKVCGEFLGPRARPLLRRLGVLDDYDAHAGPRIVRMAAYAGDACITAPLPPDAQGHFARAMARADLDTLLLAEARRAGAEVFQPCHVTSVSGCQLSGFITRTQDGRELRSRTVALAHGLAQRGDLSGEAKPPAPPAAAYVCFKTHLRGGTIPADAIAIAGARGAYAGLVRSSGCARAALAFVVRRDRLAAVGPSAETQLSAILTETPHFADLIAGAERDGPWLASGPLAPGIREIYRDGRFFLGNAAGEVHALVGEGMTLAMGSAAVLADAVAQCGLTPSAGLRYQQRWRQLFAPRRSAAGLFANLMMRPAAARPAARLLRACPPLMAACIHWAGK